MISVYSVCISQMLRANVRSFFFGKINYNSVLIGIIKIGIEKQKKSQEKIGTNRDL